MYKLIFNYRFLDFYLFLSSELEIERPNKTNKTRTRNFISFMQTKQIAMVNRMFLDPGVLKYYYLCDTSCVFYYL